VQQVGTQEELYERPANPFVARFIGHSNLVPGELAEGARLALPDGGAIRLAGHYATTGSCILAIRPERVRLCGAEDPGARVAATVEDATYVGAHVEVLLALPDGTRVILHDPTDGGTARRFAAGDRAGLAWDLASERLFDASGAPIAARTPIPA
ncbi:MAG TPA: TOBE domain-containing protein, partial [Roseomonas sp.]